MSRRVAAVPAEAERLLAEIEDDASGLGVGYADAVLKAMRTTLEDGRKISCRRRGLEITLTVGERQGQGLLRRLEHGPDVEEILRQALAEAARELGVELTIREGVLYLAD